MQLSHSGCATAAAALGAGSPAPQASPPRRSHAAKRDKDTQLCLGRRRLLSSWPCMRASTYLPGQAWRGVGGKDGEEGLGEGSRQCKETM